MKRHWSVRTQLVILVFAIALPLAMVGIFSVVSQVRVVEQRAQSRALNLAETTAANVRGFLTQTDRLLAGMVVEHGLGTLDLDACQHVVDELGLLSADFANVFVAVNARPYCSAMPASDTLSAAGSPWWEAVQRGNGLAIGKPQIGRISGQWITVAAYPIRDSDGRFVGALGAAIDLVRFQRFLASAGLPPGAVITLQDADGIVVARSEKSEEWVGRRLPGAGLESEHRSRLNGQSRTQGAEGTDRLWAYVNLPETEWRVYAGVSTEWVYAPVREAAARIGILALVALALVVAVTVSVYRRIDRSLLTLLGGTRAAALGSDAPIPLEGPKEVVQVADQFNLMLAARAEAESGVRRAEARYRSILQNAAFGIYLADADGRFLIVNPALAEMLGYDDVEALRRRRVQEIFDDAGTYLSVLRSCESKGSAKRCEVGWRRLDGSRITVRLTGSTFVSADGVRSYEVIAEDVTQHRALEVQFRQAQKMEAVGRLAGGVAHDFNNLLTVINGEARFLLEDLPAGHRTRGSAEEILASGERAAALTRQLLAFSRKEVGRPGPIDINELIENLDKMLRRLIGERIRFELKLDRAPGPVLADPTRLEQVVMNLVLNARDAMPTGGTLTIATRFETLREDQVIEEYPGLPAGAYALLCVTDTGIGMEEEVLLRVFEPFFTTKPEGQGTGLGLSTVYGIVTQSGGHISVRSRLGAGTAFTVAVPMAGEPQSAPAVVPTGAAQAPGQSTVLVVEDEQSVREMVCRVLDRGGYAVLSAENGKEALERASSYSGQIDLILTDVRMPVMNGREMAERMAILRPAARVLYMSGYVDDAIIPIEVRDDPDGFIPKPFSPGELLDHISRILSLRAGPSARDSSA